MYHKDDKDIYSSWADVVITGLYRGVFKAAVGAAVAGGVLGLTHDNIITQVQKVLFPNSFKEARPDKPVISEPAP